MGRLYKHFQSLCYDGLEWGIEKGKEKIKTEQEEKNRENKINLYGGYCKLDSIIKMKYDIPISENYCDDDYF